MIIGIDHVAFVSEDVTRDAGIFESAGYVTRFVERRIGNPAIKEPFLTRRAPTQDLVLMGADASIPIELIHDHDESSGESNLMPSFGDIPSEWTVRDDGTTGDGHVTVSAGPLEFRAEVRGTAPRARLVFDRLVSVTSDPARTIGFWRSFGFVEAMEGTLGNELRWDSPFAGRVCTLEVRSRADAGTAPRLDVTGFSCLAFVATDAGHERERLICDGISVTPIESVVIDGKGLDVFFAYGDHGEIAEVFSVVHQTRKV
ncbi:MAG: hypothetical protein V1745_00745 [Patescibacteria group bacterium]